MQASLTVDIVVNRPKFRLQVSFEAIPGITILFGPSGAGKSTILSAIAGLLRPEAGRIALGDEVWLDTRAGVVRRINDRQVAYVFQGLALFPHMTALENVVYGVRRDMKTPQRRERAEMMLSKMHVLHLRDWHPTTFSGGEAQRVALARAFAMSPRVVLMDEPFSAMDRVLRHQLGEDLRAFAEESNVPVLHVTHHRNEASALGKRVVLINNGMLGACGEIADLLPAKEMEAERRPPGSFLVAAAAITGA